MWICPKCKQPLSQDTQSWHCEAGHIYDKAKEGYVNLVLANQKRSKTPGDSKEMVNARRNFLMSGAYQPLVNGLKELFSVYGLLDSGSHIFDAGCGEGYYLREIVSGQKDVHVAGCDVSKFAVLKAAKANKNWLYAVASTFDVPVNAACFDGILQIFSPSSEAEMHRVLKEDGIWIVVEPHSHHLNEFKQYIYDDVEEHPVPAHEMSGFTLLDEKRITFTILLTDSVQRDQLLMMTPYYWAANPSQRETINASLTSITADFRVMVWRKGE
ncbi:methyltransferase domain-containing protein [Aestuariibacter sp. AA17]|uniref:Methyltransferase domain-containing protein n=1 Tax=Fluctibacter corallii TaxID=2984329 RepID=A0ABT3A981_9ALTE|nr:methyltransferase domain-containing protein [Aestuariibacter sp. AA17]MCV2885239.1 methyltransferase domain-containing protein [Aestuariibacter sp. AA17]